MAITIRSVPHHANKEFIKLQWKFYEGDPNWVPPLLFDRAKLLNVAKNPFYQHAVMELFIAEDDGIPVGRIAGIINSLHNETHGDQVGFFGFFECRDDQATADALFNHVAQWLRDRGRTVMRGPLNPSINDELGLLIDGFDSPPVILMSYNPEYYPRLLEGSGLKKSKDLYAYLMKAEAVRTPKLERGQKLVRERYGLTVRNVDFKNLKAEMKILRTLYNSAWEKNWGAVAMTETEFDFLAADLKQVLGSFKEFAFLVEIHGTPVGFALLLPDINQLLITNKRGWLIPGAWKLLTGSKKITNGRILVLGILPEYRNKGIDAVMYWEVVERAGRRNILQSEASWVLEDNMMMNRAAEELMHATRYKTYRIYDKAIS